MFSEIEHLAVAANSTSKKALSLNLILPAALILLVSLGTGCGVPSQSGTTSFAHQIVVSIPSKAAEVGVAYSAIAAVNGGNAPYSFSLASGDLPPGTTLNARTGSISGVPTSAGDYNFILSVTDSSLADHGRGTVMISVAARANQASHPHITISPNNATLTAKGTQQFTASITGSAETAVVWSASAGSISSAGEFTAPSVSSDTAVTVTAASATRNNVKAATTVNVTPIPALTVSTNSVAEANAGTPYSDSLSATGGTSPYHWSISLGALPAGIQLASSGTIAGTTSTSGTFPFAATVTDASGTSATHSYSLSVASNSVSSNSSSGFDGPAELPRVLIQTGMSDTPAPGSTITVNSGGNLQWALNSANCGDTVLLQAGATFLGQFTFPAKSCDDNHWIIVRTSADDSLLPAEGTRLTPCYAGVSSLPGRPAFNCTSTNNVLAKLVMGTTGTGPVRFAAGANHYRLVGLELTRLAGIGVVYGLASVVSGGTASNLIFDRMWMHGTAQDDTTRGVWLGGTTYASVIDSFLTDFHCVSVTGACSDAQAVAGGIGTTPMGPYKISGNFLEASGENILFGGGVATTSPADIQVSRNHFFKPLTWMKGQPGFVGGTNGNAFIVKNLFELKNAQRVLLDSNIMENSWGGFSQVGFAILLTPKNPGSTTPCPVCQVTDVTIRYNAISHVAAGFQIANGLSDYGSAALDGQRYSIHDVTIDDIDGLKYGGPGEFAQISVNAGAPPLQNLTINHVTAFPPSTLFLVGDQVAISTPIKNFAFTNSIVNAGVYPVWSTGGGTRNCAVSNKPLTTFTACFNSVAFASNAVIGSSSSFPSTLWPAGNFFPATVNDVQFMDYNGGNGGNYQLMTTSPYSNAGTDGKNLGSDVAAIESAVAGVN